MKFIFALLKTMLMPTWKTPAIKLDKLIKKNITIILLVSIFIAALFLRTIKLSEFPVGFHIDEASLGYNGYSILMTGKSDEGKFFPLYINMFGDNRPTGYHYLTVIPILFFGLSEFATRLPGAVFGALTVFPFFLLCSLFFKSKKVALLASLFLAISPWHTVLSRASAETVVALFFILFGFYLVFDFIKNNTVWKLITGTLLLGLSFFFYHTPRVFVPMFYLAAIIVISWPVIKIKENERLIKLGYSFIFLCALSFSLIFVVKGGVGRFSQVNIFGFPETKLVMEEQIREDGTTHLPLIQTRIFHNKIINYSLTFTSNYFSYFTGDFLFISGGLPIWYKVDRAGLILIIEFPLILYGIFLTIRSKDRFAKLPLFWILISPVTAALTVDDVPNIQRAIVLFPMLELMAAVGAVELFGKVSKLRHNISIVKTKHLIVALFCLILLFNFSYSLHQYFIHGKTHRTWYRNNGFSEMMKEVSKNYSQYDKIVATKAGGGYPLFLFYLIYNPGTYIKEGSPRDVDFKGFGKFIFSPYNCPSIKSDVKLPKSSKVLFIDSGTCKEPIKRTYANIYREDGSLGFRVVYLKEEEKGLE